MALLCGAIRSGAWPFDCRGAVWAGSSARRLRMLRHDSLALNRPIE